MAIPTDHSLLPSRRRTGYEILNAVDYYLVQYFRPVVCLLVLFDLLLAFVVIRRTPYTEIDWRAYMQEVAGVIENREFDYRRLRGDTGPLVYPAGFVYIFSVLYYVTNRGSSILTAQYIFAVLHSVVLALVLLIYKRYHEDCSSKTGYRPFSLLYVLALPLSRRIMSLFVLRLFNDAFQVLFIYLAVLFFACNRWSLGCFAYTASVSIKMNALLYAPGLAVLLCQALGPISALAHIVFICGGFQILVGLPFLMHAPTSYASKAFEFSRVFQYKWSVNGAFLSEPSFLDPNLSLILLLCHLVALLLFGNLRWTSASERGLFGLVGLTKTARTGTPSWLSWAQTRSHRILRPSHVVIVLFTSNVIGITFARTLHYQFYLWYFHTLPLLASVSRLPTIITVMVLVTVEAVFNLYPPSNTAALALNGCHLLLLLALWNNQRARDVDIYEVVTMHSKTLARAKTS